MKEIFPATLSYGWGISPFGTCCIGFQQQKVYALSFGETKENALEDLKSRFDKRIELMLDEDGAEKLITSIFEMKQVPELVPFGTAFQQSVWQALMQIPFGQTRSYAQIAQSINNPKAVRAVGSAIGANPIGYLIPCHRVVRTDGGLGGFRWGLECKKAMLRYEQ